MDNFDSYMHRLIEKYEASEIKSIGQGTTAFFTSTMIYGWNNDILFYNSPFSKEAGLRTIFLCGYTIKDINISAEDSFINSIDITIGNKTKTEEENDFRYYNTLISRFGGEKADSIYFAECDNYNDRWTDIEFKKSQYEIIKSYLSIKYGDGEKESSYSYAYYIYDRNIIIGAIYLELHEDIDDYNEKFYYTKLSYMQINEQKTNKYLNDL
jgi:hypothetical protein